MLPREEYLTNPNEDTALWCSVCYLDGGLTREEIHRHSSASDAYLDWQRRVSTDNGRTWSDLEPILWVVQRLPEGGMVTYPCGTQWEPVKGIAYERRMRRLWPGNDPFTFEWGDHEHPFNDHTFVVERSHGEWTEKLLRYEEGPDFDPDNPFDDAFCQTNRAYHGVSFAFAGDGTVFYPLTCHPHHQSSLNLGGLVLMRRDPQTGDWSASNQVFLRPDQSSRGILEPDAAVLTDSRVLVVARGSDTNSTPGRKWVSLSYDGGRTLEPVREFCYDDGQAFYSPSSIHTFVRSSRNGKLYWLANIVPEPPSGNGPRYPLYVAEIDEDKAAVCRDSLVLIDDRRDDDSDRVQLSNFSVLDDRETGDIQIYLTRIGRRADHIWDAGVTRYTFSPPA
jgi:hypothetical protein